MSSCHPTTRCGSASTVDDVDPAYVDALLRFEDKRFFRHGGVDPWAVVRAAALDLRHRRVVSGASTITMQLVRLLEPRPRTLASKAIEALRAAQLEARMSKREILGAYLTYTPYGGNLEGIEAASRAYFGHGADDLTADEIATLLAIPQRPGERMPSPAHATALARARDDVAAFLLAHDALPLDRGGRRRTPGALLAEVRRAPVPIAARPLPRLAPHLAYWLRDRYPPGSRIVTTLRPGSQRLVERLLAGSRRELAELGIANAAVVLLDHRSGAVEAVAGGFDYWSGGAGSQIPAFAVPRSPGSALKPFLYGLALDAGLALPEQLVVDIPRVWGGYAPDNYDGRFDGLVTLEDALSRSLNVPFVDLLARLGVEPFLGALRQAGVGHLRTTPGFYGLSAVLGSAEITPYEMAGLYAALAEDGRWRAPRLLAGAPAHPPLPLLSPGAAFLTRRALSRRDRPDFPERRRFSGAPAAIHWKTGTSYGHRDAWAVGSGPRHTAVVWLGNLDNTPRVDLVGADAAGPLLFDLLQAAERGAGPADTQVPADLALVEVCAYSGYLPTAACPTRRQVLALRRHVPTMRCPYHRAVDVDLATGLALEPGCRAGHEWQTRTFLAWPASVRRWLAERHRWTPELPATTPGCSATADAAPPTLISPQAGQVVLLLSGVPPSSQELPLAADSATPGSLSWFVDGAFLGRANADERLWWTPVPGRHEVVVVDAAGAVARRVVEVRDSGRSS